MVSPQQTAQKLIAPHYYWVQEEFIRLRAKLEVVKARPFQARGLEIVDGRAALKIWEQGLRQSSKRLHALLHSFSNTILAGVRCPSRLDTQRALITLEQEVNRLIALHRQLRQQPFALKFQEGQTLLSLCIEKIASDLNDLFSFFITTVEAHVREGEAQAAAHVWDKEIGCRTEIAEYKNWAINMENAFGLPPYKPWRKFFCFGRIRVGKRRVSNAFAGRSKWESGVGRSVVV